jgi:hypothetical protein
MPLALQFYEQWLKGAVILIKLCHREDMPVVEDRFS